MTTLHKINNPSHPVILFIPEAGIYPFIRGLSVLGDAIQRRGGRVLVTRDSGQMLRSPIMSMKKLPLNASKENKDFIYRITDKYLNRINKKYGFSFIELSDHVDKNIYKEIDDLVSKAGNNLNKVTYRGFPVGRIVQYDFILETKFPYSSKLSERHRALYSLYIKNTALTLAIADEIFQRYKPSLVITFNEYAQCQAVRYSAMKNNVRRMAMTYPVHLMLMRRDFQFGNRLANIGVISIVKNGMSGKICH